MLKGEGPANPPKNGVGCECWGTPFLGETMRTADGMEEYLGIIDERDTNPSTNVLGVQGHTGNHDGCRCAFCKHARAAARRLASVHRALQHQHPGVTL